MSERLISTQTQLKFLCHVSLSKSYEFSVFGDSSDIIGNSADIIGKTQRRFDLIWFQSIPIDFIVQFIGFVKIDGILSLNEIIILPKQRSRS